MNDDDSRASTPGDPAEAPLLLEDHFCFTLYAASRAVTGAYRPLLDELGLTYPQYLVMVVLWQHGTQSVKDLVAALQLDYGTVTPLIKRLESNGLLQRQRRLDDERIVEVALTPQGTELSHHIRAVPLAIGDAMGLTPDEFATAQGLLRQLTANVHRHTTGTEPAEAPRA
ncbi:MarR family winged helix-turn-helix transcriptional regulator [Streptomyces chiangmaiensis]|uniref:MarR family transcriptional regulator n=1 Tax=Streptomyces chiangmaiensis TaxID=766497 RepID=A0ABU7FX45_9ACTN|nr:MarR family transcriptional regulator [Streptomyces chiangmaiensis]MED7828123.1 MarR family transcriptional regulator [Streptomyces chiangmaiensis]